MKTAVKLAILMFASIVVFSCNQQTAGLQTKEDSLAFARKYFERYPDESSATIKLDTNIDTIPELSPISWKEVLQYKKDYDEKPVIFDLKGQPLRGFNVDAKAFRNIFSNKAIQGFYLRLGKKPSGTYTLMLLGTDGEGQVIIPDSTKGQLPSVFDNMPVCPPICAKDFEDL